MLPPGRLRVLTRPNSIGSPPTLNTIGIVAVAALAAGADVVKAMNHRLATVEGRAVYAQRKSTVEPVFGIIKSVMGFRQFHVRGLDAVTGEWTLVTMAWNLKRLFNLRSAAASTTAAANRRTSRRRTKRPILAAGRNRNCRNGPRSNISRSFPRQVIADCDSVPLAVGLTPTGC